MRPITLGEFKKATADLPDDFVLFVETDEDDFEVAVLAVDEREGVLVLSDAPLTVGDGERVLIDTRSHPCADAGAEG